MANLRSYKFNPLGLSFNTSLTKDVPLTIDPVIPKNISYMDNIRKEFVVVKPTNHLTEMDDYVEDDIGFMLLSTDGIIKEVNYAAAKLLMQNKITLTNSHFIDIVAFKDTSYWIKHLTNSIKLGTRKKFDCEISLVRGNRSSIFVRIDGVFLAEENLEPTIRLILTDINVRKKSESILDASDTRFLNVINGVEPRRQTIRDMKLQLV